MILDLTQAHVDVVLSDQRLRIARLNRDLLNLFGGFGDLSPDEQDNRVRSAAQLTQEIRSRTEIIDSIQRIGAA